MTVFGSYAEYYDLFYGDKDYGKEAAYVKTLLNKYGEGKVKKILDLGCGTGRHDVLLAELGYEMTGVDRSPEMLALAKSRPSPCHFLEGDVRNIKIDEQFDAVIALFHVMSYQTTNDDVLAVMRTACDHLRTGGIFIFDFWYGPAVLAQRPERRIKEMENEKIKVIRRCEPVVYLDRNVVDVNYEIHITQRSSLANPFSSPIRETHSMRYFFKPELERFLSSTGFDKLKCVVWMTEKEPMECDWSAVMVAEKK